MNFELVYIGNIDNFATSDTVTLVEIVPVLLTEASTHLQVEMSNLVGLCKENTIRKNMFDLRSVSCLS